jgi:CRISPR-associated protein (TIGR02710 family)
MDDQEQFNISLPPFQQSVGKQRFRGLVLVGSNQPITAALLVATLMPERVAFLLTTATQDMPDRVAALLHCTHDGWICPEGDYTSVTNVYQGLRNVLTMWSDLSRPEIAVDVTAGMKQMSIGLAQAAHLEHLTTVYVKSEYDKVANRVKPGSQEFEIIPDPYLVFGDLEAAEARRQFSQHNYAVAARLFGELASRVPEPHCRRYAAAAALAAAYADWEVFAFDEAGAHLDTLLALPPADLAEIAPHRHTLEQQRAALARLHAVAQSVVRRGNDALCTLANPAAILPLLGTLHAAALRRAEQGRYDFAALFRYRCLELISQHRLAVHGLLSHAPDYKVLPHPKADLSACFRSVQRQLGRKQPKKLPDRITLFDGYMLLAALDDPLVRGYPIKQIEDRSHARNRSVLAHGYELISQQNYEHFAQVVDEMLDRLFVSVLHQSRAAWEASARFIML